MPDVEYDENQKKIVERVRDACASGADADAVVSFGCEYGAYVQTWEWVSFEDINTADHKVCGDCYDDVPTEEATLDDDDETWLCQKCAAEEDEA
tara:strand:+ start:2615 stop:2896 length:282 start_codon:yes stop_codon:yes gene_type:complete